MPLGLLGLLLPNKHSQDLLPSLPLFCLSGHLPLFRLPMSLLSLTSCSSLYHPFSILPFLPPSFFSGSFSPLCDSLVLPFPHAVSSVVRISPEDVWSPCLGNVNLPLFPMSLFMWVKNHQMEGRKGSEVSKVCCRSRGHIVQIRKWRAPPPPPQLHHSTHTLSPSPGLRWLCPCTLSELGFHPLCQLKWGSCFTPVCYNRPVVTMQAPCP